MLDAILSPALPEDCNPVIMEEILFTSAGMQTTTMVVDSGHPHSLGWMGYHSWEEDVQKIWQPIKSKSKWEKRTYEAIRTFNARDLLLSVLKWKEKGGLHPGHRPDKLRTVLSETLHSQPSRYFRWASQQLRDAFSPADLPSLLPTSLARLFMQHDEAKFTAAVEYSWCTEGQDLSQDVADNFLKAVDYLMRGNEALDERPNDASLPNWRRKVARTIVADETAMDLWVKLTTVPPSIMRQCHPKGRKWETFAAARVARALTELACYAKTPIVGDQMDNYARLACHHDSGHTIDTLLGTFPELRSAENLDQIVKYGIAFNAKKILMLALNCNASATVRAGIIGPAADSDGRTDHDIPPVLRPDAKVHIAAILAHHSQAGVPQFARNEAYT